MVKRSFWNKLLESALEKYSVIWLTGVPGVGKSCLCETIGNADIYDCSDPGTRLEMMETERFVKNLKGKISVLDEIQQVPNFRVILSLAAAQSPATKVIATSPFSIHAFPELAEAGRGKMIQIWLTPMMSKDLEDFGRTNLRDRFLKGGLPPFFLNAARPEKEFQDWVNLLWARWVPDPFRVERRNSFCRFTELLFSKSNELFEAKKFVEPCGISHPTVFKYLSALQASRAVLVVRPFSTRHSTEIISTPKTYAGDTGFFCYFRGWKDLREEDFEILWKHWVLNELCSHLQGQDILYWRDKRGHEIDFIIITKKMGITAIICPWKASEFEVRSLKAFRHYYPEGRNWIVCGDKIQGHSQNFGKLRVEFMSLHEMRGAIEPIGGIQ